MRASVDGEKIQTFRAGEKKFTMRAKICEDFVSIRRRNAQRKDATEESDHVCISVDPCRHVSDGHLIERASDESQHRSTLTNRRHQDKNLRDCCRARRLLVLRTQSAEYVCASLPECGHDDDPAEAVAIDDGLGKMRDGQDAEEDREYYGGGEAGRVLPEGIASLGGDVAMSGGSCV